MRETTLDDICTVVGYSATRVLQAWYAGRAVYVPRQASPEHPLYALLGPQVLRALVEAYPGEQLKVPNASADAWAVRDRRIAEMLAAGATVADVAAEVDLSERRVQQVREELLLRGWIAYAEGYRAAAGRGRARIGAVPEILGTGEVVRG